MKGISFGAKAKQPALKPRPASKKSAFGGGDSDSDEDAKPVASGSKAPPPPPVRAANNLTRAQKAQLAAAEAQDASVFVYDEVFDSMKSAQQTARDSVKQESQDRKPRYIENLLKTAEQRKLDHARAEDVMVQREREKEGDAFKDSESFVTEAYKAQQDEIRKAEEAEKAKGASSGGMAKFYEQYLSNSAQAHQAASEAAKSQESSSSTKIQQPVYDDEPVSDVHLAREAASRLQKVVQVNEDGQVVDRTELLSGGLNVSAPRKPQGPVKPGEELGGFAIPIAERARREREERLAAKEAQPTEEPHWSGRDRRELERERKMRQSAAVEQQILEMKKRQAEEANLEHEQRVQKVAKRNDSSRVEALKKAAAERRKAKAEQETA